MHLSELARSNPDKPAIHVGDEQLSYGRLDALSRRLSRQLAGLGLRLGDHVALLMSNQAAFLVAAWAAQRSGLLYTPVNWHLTEAEAGYVVRDCRATVLITTADLHELARAVSGDAHLLQLSRDGAIEPPGYELPEPADVEGTYFFYSSGTTGLPKGIAPAHDYPAFGAGLAVDHALGAAFGFDAHTVYLCPAPLYHAAPLGWSMAVHRHHGQVVVLPAFDAVECLKAIERHRVTHAQFVPTHLVRLLKLPNEIRERYDLSSLQCVVHAAAPCPPDIKRAAIEWLGPKVFEIYAGSEGIGMTTISSGEWLRKPGSVGRAAVGELHILDDEGNELPPGQVGTVYFANGGSFDYTGAAATSAKPLDPHGWATLGDLGHVDDDGYLFLSDRRIDLILSGGVNVYPAEVEAAVISHPDVRDVAVVGIPDAEWGQRIHASVQLEPGCDWDELLPRLQAHTRERLAAFKCPRSWQAVEQVPRLPNGKLLRRVLREELS